MKLIKELRDLDVTGKIIPKSKEDYKIRTAARAIILDSNNLIALISIPRQGYHKLPGGGLEEGEEIKETLIREVKEEAGIDIKPEWKGFATVSKDGSPDWEVHVFVAEGFGGSLKECPEGELSWVNKSDLGSLEMPEGDKAILPLLFEDRKFHVHWKYDEYKNLIDSSLEFL